MPTNFYDLAFSKRTIEGAVANLDSYNDGLVGLQEAMLVAAALASRDRGLSTTAEMPGPLS